MGKATKYVIGLDYGTNSVRALLVEAGTGKEIAASTWVYEHGEMGVVLDPKSPNLWPGNIRWITSRGIEKTVVGVLKQVKKQKGFLAENVIGIGRLDTTGSTPLPVDENFGNALVRHRRNLPSR